MTDAFATFDEDHLIEDCCDILGVDEDATLDEIRSAFRQQAKLLHPDRNRSATATDDFIRLGEAYRILRDAAPRRAVDDRAQSVATAPPRPRWSAAGAVALAFVVSIGAASTFAYLGLRGGPVPVPERGVAKVATAVSTPLPQPALGQHAQVATIAVEHVASSKPLISTPRSPDVPVSDTDVTDAEAFEALADAAQPAGTPPPRPETDETLVASLADLMNAPLADAQTRPPLYPHVQTPPRVASQSALRPGRNATRMTTAAQPQHVARRVTPVLNVATASIAKLIVKRTAKPVALRQPAAAPRLVRVFPWRPYPVRAAMYARYPSVAARRVTARRYQAQQWRAAPDDWPF